MATSGVSQYKLDIIDIMEDAFERIGRPDLSSEDGITAIRSFNLMMLQWETRGVHHWTLEQQVLPLLAGEAQYDLDDDTSNVLPYASIRQYNNTTYQYNDFPAEAWRRDDYESVVTKLFQARPHHYLIERNRDNPVVTFYPVPDSVGEYAFVYWRIRYMEDIKVGTNNPDLPRRFLPAAVSGLAYYLSDKAPYQVDINRRAELKARYEEDFKYAQDEDRDLASTYIKPSLRRSY